jgi:hypothetical protein
MSSPSFRAATQRRSMPPAMLIRLIHTYVGVFIAPSVLFFALTGSLQLFRLHEGHGSYTPPPVIERLGTLHKDQVFKQKRRGPPKAKPVGQGADAAIAKPEPEPKPEKATPLPVTALRVFFLLVALGLVTSTSLGLWMALTQQRDRRVVWGLLGAGAVIPLLILLL